MSKNYSYSYSFSYNPYSFDPYFGGNPYKYHTDKCLCGQMSTRTKVNTDDCTLTNVNRTRVRAPKDAKTVNFLECSI